MTTHPLPPQWTLIKQPARTESFTAVIRVPHQWRAEVELFVWKEATAEAVGFDLRFDVRAVAGVVGEHGAGAIGGSVGEDGQAAGALASR